MVITLCVLIITPLMVRYSDMVGGGGGTVNSKKMMGGVFKKITAKSAAGNNNGFEFTVRDTAVRILFNVQVCPTTDYRARIIGRI